MYEAVLHYLQRLTVCDVKHSTNDVGALCSQQQIKSREKAMERMLTGPDAVKKPPRPGKPFVFRFPAAPRASEEVMNKYTNNIHSNG
jgi:hypothetical protein